MSNFLIKFFSRNTNRLTDLASIQMLEKRLDEQTIKKACSSTPIVVIDNEAIGRMEHSLKASGFNTVRALRRIDSIRDVDHYQIVLIDIHGVGRKLSIGGDSLPYEGLSVAEEIKRQYPMKKVLVFSATLSEYSDNYILRNVVDGSFDKDGNIVERNALITNQVEALINPRCRWMDIRSRLLALDIPLQEIAELEDYFVRTIQTDGRKMWDVDHASGILGNIKEAVAIVKDIACIVATVANPVP